MRDDDDWADDFDSKLTGLCDGLYFRKEGERGIKNDLKDSDSSVLVANCQCLL